MRPDAGGVDAWLRKSGKEEWMEIQCDGHALPDDKQGVVTFMEYQKHELD